MKDLFYVVEYGTHQIPEGKVTLTSSFALTKFVQNLPEGTPFGIEQHMKISTPHIDRWVVKTIKDRRIT